MTLLDGAMGTALIAAGLPAGSVPEGWLLTNPEQVARVHAAHAAAGAEVLLTCTFNLAGPRLREASVSAPLDLLARRAVALARRAGPGLRVAGAVGPAFAPGAPVAALAERFWAGFQALAGAGADLLWVESLPDPAQARAALAAARGTGLPTVATFTFSERGGRLACAAGEDPLDALVAAADEGAAAVGVNCALPGAPLEALIARAARRLVVPLVAKPSAGLGAALMTPAAFGAWLARLHAAGASWLGGCCGAGAAHLSAARRAVDRQPCGRA